MTAGHGFTSAFAAQLEAYLEFKESWASTAPPGSGT